MIFSKQPGKLSDAKKRLGEEDFSDMIHWGSFFQTFYSGCLPGLYYSANQLLFGSLYVMRMSART